MTVAGDERLGVAVPAVIVSRPVVRIENFLDPTQMAALLNWAVRMRDKFAASSVTTGVQNYRRSRVIRALAEARPEMETMIRTCLPLLRQVLGAPATEPSLIEMQLTVSHDGDFFKVHVDQSPPETENRLVSFVYYFTSDDASFTGGDLLLYDSPMGVVDPASCAHHVVPPTRNSIVFFRSDVWHQVTPVSNLSGDFAAGRFTVNGWMRW